MHFLIQQIQRQYNSQSKGHADGAVPELYNGENRSTASWDVFLLYPK